MNTRIIKIIISLSMLVMLTGIAVNAQDFKLTANIPFEFAVGDVAMPAGECDVTKLNIGSEIFRVRDQEGRNVAMRFVIHVQRAKAPTETIFVFNRYWENGGEASYFLSQIWVEGVNRGYEFLKHRAEREAALRSARRDIITIVVPRTNRRAE